MTRRAPPAAAILLACCAAGAEAGWWDDAGVARRTTLDEIRIDPDRWRDVTVAMDVRFARFDEPGDANATRFTAKHWRSVAVLTADAATADLESADAFTRIFVRRGSEDELRLAEVTKGRRVQLRAAVRDTVKGEPWFEVLDVVGDGDPLTPEESAAIARGADLLVRDNAASAETLLRRLLAGRVLPEAAQAEIWRRIGEACWAQRRIAESVDAYAAALVAAPGDEATVAKFAAARTLLAALPQRAEPEIAGPGVEAKPGTPTAPPRAPSRHLLPPAGFADTPRTTRDPAPVTPAPDAPEQKSGKFIARPERPAPAPAAEPPAEESPAPPPPPAPSKSKLSGPK